MGSTAFMSASNQPISQTANQPLDLALRRLAGAQLVKVDGVWVNESVRGRDLKYYIFDWDDNILCMPTTIYMERRNSEGKWVPHRCTTATFSVIRKDEANYRYPGNDRSLAFVGFQDDDAALGGRVFLNDLERALDAIASGERKPPLSFNTFKKTLIEGRLFAIVTARGHEPETVRRGVERFIERVLTPTEREEMLINLRGYEHCFDKVQTFPSQQAVLNRYLSLCKYHAITSPTFEALVAENASEVGTVEAKKRFAIHDFVEHIVGILDRTGMDALKLPMAIGFSDDDKHNVEAVRIYVEEVLARRFPGVKFCVYDTSDIEGGVHKMMISGQMELPLE